MEVEFNLTFNTSMESEDPKFGVVQFLGILVFILLNIGIAYPLESYIMKSLVKTLKKGHFQIR